MIIFIRLSAQHEILGKSLDLPQTRIFFFNSFIHSFILGCVGSSFLCEGFLQLRRGGPTLHRGARASHCRGLSCCRAQAPDGQAQQLWLTSPVAPWHVGSSQTRARTRVPCIGRQIPNHCATREAPDPYFFLIKNVLFYNTVLSTIVTMFYIGSSKLMHLITESLYPLTKFSLFPPPQPAAPGNHFSTLCFYDFDVFYFVFVFRFHI